MRRFGGRVAAEGTAHAAHRHLFVKHRRQRNWHFCLQQVGCRSRRRRRRRRSSSTCSSTRALGRWRRWRHVVENEVVRRLQLVGGVPYWWGGGCRIRPQPHDLQQRGELLHRDGVGVGHGIAVRHHDVGVDAQQDHAHGAVDVLKCLDLDGRALLGDSGAEGASSRRQGGWPRRRERAAQHHTRRRYSAQAARRCRKQAARPQD